MALEVRDATLRGEFGTDLNARVAGRLGAAFARFLHQHVPSTMVAVGRDTRATGANLLAHFLAGLAAYPCRVLDAGVVPTPSLAVAAGEWGARASVMVTAGRAPSDWNGFRFSMDGLPLDPAAMRDLRERYRWAPVPKPARPLLEKRYGQAGALHVDRLRALLPDVRLDLRAGVDAGRGAAEAPLMALLDALGARTFPVHTVRDHHTPETGLKPLATRVIRSGCQLGIATGWEGLLLILVDEKGRRLSRHQTLALALGSFLELHRDAVVVARGPQSRMIEALIEELRVERRTAGTPRAAVEELASLSREKRQAVGIDLTGELTWPSVCHVPDGLAALLLILRSLALRRVPLSVLCEDLPPFASAEVSLPRPTDLEPSRLARDLAAAFPQARLTGPGQRRPWSLRADLEGGGWVALSDSVQTSTVDVWAEVPLPDRPEALTARVQELLGFPSLAGRQEARSAQ
ncbi:MAG: hypothetical protein AB1758_07635 [Candidatus Eremiobacterota bacterium]